jgi:phage FluMu protein Com
MTNTKCAKCGLVNFATATECKRCGVALASGGANGISHSFGGNGNSFNSNANSFQGNVNSFSSHVAPSGGGQASTAGLYYQPSGEVTVAGLAAGLLGGLVAGVFLAFLYSYIISYVPFIYLNLLCTIGYAVGLGATVGGLMRGGKMRNPAVCVFSAIAVTLVSFYASWAVWLAVTISGKEFSVSWLTLAQQPLVLWDVILKINETGAWSMGRSKVPVTGIFLWVVWGVEALVILVGSPLMAWSILTSDLFCESCQSWCEEDKSLVSLAIAESAELKRRVEAKDFEYLKSVGAKVEGDAMWYRLDLHKCPSCENTNALSVKLEKLKIDSKGNATTQTSDLMDKLLLSATEVSQLRQVSVEMPRRTQQAA